MGCVFTTISVVRTLPKPIVSTSRRGVWRKASRTDVVVVVGKERESNERCVRFGQPAINQSPLCREYASFRRLGAGGVNVAFISGPDENTSSDGVGSSKSSRDASSGVSQSI